MERIILASLIGAVALAVFLTGKVLSYISVVLVVILFMGGYTWLMGIAMVHQKRMSLKYPKPVNTDYQPDVCVIIAAHNEEAVIADTVRCMLQVDYDKLSVLVMDDRSTDKTAEILKALSEELNDSRFHYYTRSSDAFPGKSAVLNEAMILDNMGGTAEVIAVFDADAKVEPDFLRKMLPFLADQNVGAAQARKIITNADDNWLTMCQNYEYSGDAHFQMGRSSIYGAVELRGNGELLKRAAVLDVGGFNEHSVTDDLDMATRLHLSGWDIRFAHKVHVFEEGITEFKALLKQRKRWAHGNLMRYLEHAGDILTSEKVSLRAAMDMVAYLSQFMLPLWLVLDAVNLGIDILDGVERIRMISSFLLIPIILVFTWLALITAIIRFNRPPFWETVKGATITGFYMMIIWFPITFWEINRILFQKERGFKWERTTHVGAASN